MIKAKINGIIVPVKSLICLWPIRDMEGITEAVVKNGRQNFV